MEQFPIIKGSNLEGKKYNIPVDLEGEYNLLMIPFLRYQQALINEWTVPLLKLQTENPTFRFYEIPTLSKGYTPMRFMIDGGMKAGIADLQTRMRTITVYINKVKFKKQLKIKTEDTIYLYLVKDSRIIWEEKGRVTDKKIADLKAQIKS